ncbi:MAG: DUF4442 domain-containing protein [Crocinitomicaceae bacterium]|nr:DUF4442 domain-containing protein [Crocinitomicaceae bacterium]
MPQKNLNHIKGIHACGLATAAEFASGFYCSQNWVIKKYRLIMQSLEMKYLYQAKTDSYAVFKANDEWIDKQVIEPLKYSDQVYVKCEIRLFDNEENHIATGYTNWQIKEWKSVKTKM